MNATLPDIASLAVKPDMIHAAAAAHGTLFFKLLDVAAFYAGYSGK